jgi:hypothetical protein
MEHKQHMFPHMKLPRNSFLICKIFIPLLGSRQGNLQHLTMLSSVLHKLNISLILLPYDQWNSKNRCFMAIKGLKGEQPNDEWKEVLYHNSANDSQDFHF